MDGLPARSAEDCSKNQKNRQGRSRSGNLREQVVHPEMWPTPRVSDTEGGVVKNVEKKNNSYSRVNKKGVRFGVKLKDAVGYEEDRTWPTPSTRDYKGGHGTIVEEDGKYYRVSNTTGTKYGARLDAQVEKMEADRTWPTPMVDDAKNVTPNPKRFKGSLYAEVHDSVWPTPSANEDAAGTPNGKMQRMLGNHPGIRGTTQKEFNKGALNPDWVEWLMGYAPGYTDPEYTEPMQLAEHLGFESEPDIPRVTTRKEHRVNRLKCLGNSIVPQIMYEIGKAILKDKEAEGVK
jgi:hypothetical protein